MKTRRTLIAAALAALLGGLVVPALAETSGGSSTVPGQDMGVGRMGHGMSGGMMSGGNMSGCMGMMRSMNNGDGRPNSQWQKHPPGDRSMPN
jgi:hypothetical protein